MQGELKFVYKDGHVRMVHPTRSFFFDSKTSVYDKVVKMAADTGLCHTAELWFDEEYFLIVSNPRNEPYKPEEIPPNKYRQWRNRRKKLLKEQLKDLRNPIFTTVNGQSLQTIRDLRKLRRKGALIEV